MSSQYGYDVYIDGLILPITPGEITSKFGSTNEVVTLINEGEINILKSPSLTEISFDARFPMRKFPYSREPLDFKAYYKHFNELKVNKKPFRFIVARRTLRGIPTWDTNLEMALEEFEVKESADEGDDVIISFQLKQYKNYGVKTLAGGLVKSNNDRSSNVVPTNTNTTQTPSKKYKDTDVPPTIASTANRVDANTPIDTPRNVAVWQTNARVNANAPIDMPRSSSTTLNTKDSNFKSYWNSYVKSISEGAIQY